MRQIIAIGGGGFSEGSDNLTLDQYILKQTKKSCPKICFLPTASGDAYEYIERFYDAFNQLTCYPSILSLFRLPTRDLESFILEKDIIYVGGGNTRSMLALWREWKVDLILRKAYENGIILAGISAGANCWFKECITDSIPGDFTVLPTLGFLSGSFCPHYNVQAERRPSLHRLLAAGQIVPGLAADNDAAVHFMDEKIVKAVSSKREAKVYRVQLKAGQVVEEEIETVCLV